MLLFTLAGTILVKYSLPTKNKIVENDTTGIEEKNEVSPQQESIQAHRDHLVDEINKDEALLKELQQKIRKNKEQFRKWLSLMG